MRKTVHPLLTAVLSTIMLFGLTLFSQAANAAIASVSNNSLAKEEVFQLKIVAEENLDSDDIDFSVLEKDFFTGTPRFGFYTNITNGKKSVRSEWSLSLAPLRSGILTIPAFQVGNSHTQPIKITVSVDPTAKTQDDLVEVQVRLKKPRFYPGELNQLDTRIIIRANSRQVQQAQLSPPQVQDNVSSFTLEPIGESKQYQSIIDGMEVIVVDQSYAVSARQPGKFVINGPTFKGAIVDVSRRTGSSRIVPIDTKPDILIASVLEKPADYQGNWLPSSNLKLEQQWFNSSGTAISESDQLTLSVGDPITRQITISAEGASSDSLPNLNIPYPDSIRVYQESPQITLDGDTATLTLKQVLIAKSEGDINLPDVNLNWWNTSRLQSEQAKAKGLTLAVEAAENTISQPVVAPAVTPAEPQIITETVTVKDAGFWPYLTAGVGALWLITLGFLLKEKANRKPAAATASSEPQTGSGTDAIIQAIKEKDGFRAQALFNNWLKEDPDLPEGTISEIRQEFGAMHKALYGNGDSSWDEKKLIKRLKKNRKVATKKTKKEQLASL